MKKTRSIVILGLDFNSPNFGCSALGYSFLRILELIARKKELKFKIYSVNYHSFSCNNYNDLCIIEDLQIHYKSPFFYKKFLECIRKADLIIDFTGGDSFTDLYGLSRFVKESILKELAIRFGNRTILGPQTIGPFENDIAKTWAVSIMKRCHKIYVRDNLSKKYANELGIKCERTTDIAFLLPEEKIAFHSDSKKTKIGFNVSALMKNDGYKFSSLKLKMNYEKFCCKLIEKMNLNHFEIHLISHVQSKDNVENDYDFCSQLHNKYKNTILAPKFKNPMQAKSYMSNMDCVIGSRMHATVGAFSMGVPIIAVAYSRKFQGLYETIDYPYIIDAKKSTEDQAVEKILEWLSRLDDLKTAQTISLNLVNQETKKFISSFENFL